MKKKTLALLLACCLIVGVTAGGTLAWLTADTQEVKNTFAPSDIGVTLTEDGTTKVEETGNETKEYKMVPGWIMEKNPVVTVAKDSEDCYLFVKVEKTGKAQIGETPYGIDDYLAYTLATEVKDGGWTQLTDDTDAKTPVDNVYWRIVKSSNDDQPFHLLLAGSYGFGKETYSWAQDQVLTKPDVTKEMMNALNDTDAVKPSITFTAYASQLYKTNKPGAGATDEEITAAQFTPAEAWANVPKS